jgi:hypothetical protein
VNVSKEVGQGLPEAFVVKLRTEGQQNLAVCRIWKKRRVDMFRDPVLGNSRRLWAKEKVPQTRGVRNGMGRPITEAASGWILVSCLKHTKSCRFYFTCNA